MVEGVLAVDADGRILELNAAAARLLDLSSDQARGRSIQEAVRNLDLQKFISATVTDGGPAETEIVIYGNEERFLQLHGTALTDPTGRKLGVLVVLNDNHPSEATGNGPARFCRQCLARTETPITTLKGCVETLTDTAPGLPEETRRFVSMMDRHVDRLQAIVDDLLSLSRIEFDAERGQIRLEPGRIGDVLKRAAGCLCGAGAGQGNSVMVECPDDVEAAIDVPLLEQAVGNLIDNAIKYSDNAHRST